MGNVKRNDLTISSFIHLNLENETFNFIGDFHIFQRYFTFMFFFEQNLVFFLEIFAKLFLKKFLQNFIFLEILAKFCF